VSFVNGTGNPDFASFLELIAGSVLGTAAITLSATVVKRDLIPDQLGWLSAAGSLVSACVLVLAFAFRPLLVGSKVKATLAIALVLTVMGVLLLRANLVHQVALAGNDHSFLVGWGLSERGQQCWDAHKVTTPEQFIQKCDWEQIPALYRHFTLSSITYVFMYLSLLTCFSLLVGSIRLSGFKNTLLSATRPPA
jgi:hypothetical protein